MGYYTEISNSEYAAKDTALINRMQGNDSHSIVGAMLATNATNILGAGLTIFGKLTAKDTVPEEENPDSTEERTSNTAKFNDLRREFKNHPSQETARELQEFYTENSSDNTIHNGYKILQKDVEEYLKKSA